MPSRSYLRAASHARATPNREARPVAVMKYSVPVGWMFLFADTDRVSYTRPDEPARTLFFFRAPLAAARQRLARAVRGLAGHPYLGACFGALEALGVALDAAGPAYAELDLEEVLAMGEPGDEFEQQIRSAPARLLEVLDAVAAKDLARALELLNSLRDVSGLELSGDPGEDAEAWKRELSFHKLASPEDLCRRWVAGEIG
jgi:hypothetical protein